MSTPTYRILFRQFEDTVNYGKGSIVAELQNAKNIGWAYYVNDVPEMFWTMNQDDPKLADIQSYLNGECHIDLYRDNVLVWSGWPLEMDETENDVVFYAYGYAAAMYWQHTGWGTTWTDAQLDTIFTDVMDTIITAGTDSLLGWTTAGTIEAPVTTSGGAVALTLPLYKVYRKRALFVAKELVAVAASDTTNRVWFEITPAGVYNLWKNKGDTITTTKLEYPGLVQGFHRVRVPAHRRNIIYGIGSSPQDVVLQSVQADTSDSGTRGRREEAINLEWVRDQSELDRVTKLRLKRAKRVESHMRLRLARGAFDPYPVSTAPYSLMDTIPVKINRGITQLDDSYLIVGQEVIFENGEERVMPLIQDKLV